MLLYYQIIYILFDNHINKAMVNIDNKNAFRCPFHLDMLPLVFICQLCELIDVPDLIRLSLVCRSWYDFFQYTSEFWKIKGRPITISYTLFYKSIGLGTVSVDDWKKFCTDESYRTNILFTYHVSITDININENTLSERVPKAGAIDTLSERVPKAGAMDTVKIIGQEDNTLNFNIKSLIFPYGNVSNINNVHDYLSCYIITDFLDNCAYNQNQIFIFYSCVIDHINPKHSIFKFSTHNFTESKDRGWSRMAKLKHIHDKTNGYVNNNHITIKMGLLPKITCLINIYLDLYVVIDYQLFSHSGRELFDLDNIYLVRVFANDTIQTLINYINKKYYNYDNIHCWKLVERSNDTIRPQRYLSKSELTVPIYTIFFNAPIKGIFIETQTNRKNDPETNTIMIFIKYFDIVNNTITYLGNILVDKYAKFITTIPKFTAMLNSKQDDCNNDSYIFFEELNLNKVTPININNSFFDMDMESGDIFIFQRRILNTFNQACTTNSWTDPLSLLNQTKIVDTYLTLYSCLITIKFEPFPDDVNHLLSTPYIIPQITQTLSTNQPDTFTELVTTNMPCSYIFNIMAKHIYLPAEFSIRFTYKCNYVPKTIPIHDMSDKPISELLYTNNPAPYKIHGQYYHSYDFTRILYYRIC